LIPKLTTTPSVGEATGKSFPGRTPVSTFVHGDDERQVSGPAPGSFSRSLPKVMEADELAGTRATMASATTKRAVTNRTEFAGARLRINSPSLTGT
jgi:hypothetical protein